MLNKVILMGRFTKDPELKSTPQGVSVCNFRIGVTRNYKTGQNYESDFIDCVAWRNTAEFISRYFKKGNLVCVEGSLQSRNWEQDGQKRYALDVVVDNTYFVEGKKGSESTTDAAISIGTEDTTFSSGDFSAIEADDGLPF
ncbi:MAG: single-stranded DNA-binding protein [Bacillota bacterium]|nr:single-stranded DNA-binding protein [Bacillota bacterium]